MNTYCCGRCGSTEGYPGFNLFHCFSCDGGRDITCIDVVHDGTKYSIAIPQGWKKVPEDGTIVSSDYALQLLDGHLRIAVGTWHPAGLYAPMKYVLWIRKVDQHAETPCVLAAPDDTGICYTESYNGKLMR